MNPSRIEQSIDDIYNYVEGCKPSKLYPNKVVVERGELYDLMDQLRICAPDEIKRYQKIINNRDSILGEAQRRAGEMLQQAQQQTAQILDQNELVQLAYQRAEEIMGQVRQEAEQMILAAQDECDQMRRAALIYTNDLLAQAQANVEESLREMDSKHRMLTSALKNSIQVMRNNREELAAQLEPEKHVQKQQAEEEAAASGMGEQA